MDNCSNCTTPRPDTFQTTGFLVFSITMLLIAVAAIFFNILTAVVLSTRKEVLPPIRILLVNLLAGTTFTAVAVVIQNTDSIVILSNDFNETTEKDECRVYVWFFRSSAVVRLCNLAAYSIAVMTVVIKGKRMLKSVHALLSVVITWPYALLVPAYSVFPAVSTYVYIGPSGSWCTTDSSTENPEEMALLAMWLILGGIIPMAVCVTVIISTWCYLRRHNLSEVTRFRKGLVRLALFLILANTLNLINTTVPPILIKAILDEYVLPYIVSTIVTILLWNTAIFVVVFIPPIRSKMVAILCCFCNQRQPGKSLGGNAQTPSNETALLVK